MIVGGGIVYLTKKGGEFREEKGVGGPASSSLAGKRGGFLGPDAVAVIANNRAEPTTEVVVEKGIDDIQPFVGDRIAVTHNGTIANDSELERRYGIRKRSRIDSSVLPPHCWNGRGMDRSRICNAY